MTYTRLAAFMTILCSGIITFLAATATLEWMFPGAERPARAAAAILALAGFLLCMKFRIPARLREVYGDFIRDTGGALIKWTEAASPRAIALSIVALAAISLFLELVLIRWQGGFFPIFALYKNFTLLACFCGLGIGYALARDKQLYLSLTLPMLALTLVTLSFLRYVGDASTMEAFSVVPVREEAYVAGFAAQQAGPAEKILHDLPAYYLLFLTFMLNVLVLLPIAQFCGLLMQRKEALRSYGLNLSGSIAGVVLLFLLSWLWIGPVAWFGLPAALLLWYQAASPVARAPALACSAVILLVTVWPFDPMVQSIYSPYQLIQKAAMSDGRMIILSAGSYYQKVYDLSLRNANRESDAASRRVVGHYELPFRTAIHPGRVAIAGAGSGNDVAAALRTGATEVYAAEIDPAIRALGVANHPEHPYDDPRAHAIVDDARTFFRNTSEQFDTIVYGVLDSHVLLSHGSNVRVDSFVYTEEGLRDAYAHLKQGGLMSLSFALPNDLMGSKIYRMLKALPEAGAPVAVLTRYDNSKTTTFMIRRGAKVALPADFLKAHDLVDETKNYAGQADAQLDLPSDDWPFFYMDHKAYPVSYIVSLFLIMTLAALLVRDFLPTKRWDAGKLPFFFLGAGFMLVETKAITELGLLFGNTWHVVGIAIIGVLTMGYLANLMVERFRVRRLAVLYALLFGLIALGYAVACHGGFSINRFAMLFLLVGPLAFSGGIFSVLLKNRDDVPDVMAYNLMGAMLGGVMEYNSMQFGFASLYLFALMLYAAACLSNRKAS